MERKPEKEIAEMENGGELCGAQLGSYSHINKTPVVSNPPKAFYLHSTSERDIKKRITLFHLKSGLFS